MLELLENDCLTTDRIAQVCGMSEAHARAELIALARQGAVNLVSYGWNFKLAWSCIDLDEFPSDPHCPWHMTARDRALELS